MQSARELFLIRKGVQMLWRRRVRQSSRGIEDMPECAMLIVLLPVSTPDFLDV
jgi:hypothetical protein